MIEHIQDLNKEEARLYARRLRKDLILPNWDTKRLADFLHEQGAHCVLAYHPMNGEPDPAPLASQFRLLTTRTHWKTRTLTLHAYEAATELTRQGYKQPPLHTPAVSLEKVDAVLLPALAFDIFGTRLGYGGGFYDRLLESYTGLMVGMTYEAFLWQKLPAESHDKRVSYIATEKGFYASCS